MRFWSALLVLLVVCDSAAGTEASDSDRCEPWAAGPYEGSDATGEHVIALWQFDAGDPLADASGHAHELKLRGASIAAEGRFGGGLASFPGWPVNDQQHAATAAHDSALSPSGGFTLEMWIRPKPELNADYPESFLLDKKYVAHDDYQLILGAAERGGTRVLRACLGFGADSATYYSQPARFEPGTWYHVAFTYDGAGEGRFYLDGVALGGGQQAGRKSISPGRHVLSIGDRIGSYYHGFPGFIDQVRISRGAREFRRLRVDSVSKRRVFVRKEADAQVRLTVTNLQPREIAEAAVSISWGGAAPQRMTLGPLAPGQSLPLDYPLDTSFRPDQLRLTVRVEVTDPRPYQVEEAIALQIVPRKSPEFPVLMWGIYGGVSAETSRLKRIGFTHVLSMGADYQSIFQAGAPTAAADEATVERTRQALDDALANGLTLAASLSPGAALRSREAYRRVGRDGQPTAREDICGLFPDLKSYCFNVGAAVAGSYGDHPALAAALLHTEVRDHASPCFHEHDRQAFRQHAGFDIPEQVTGPRGVDYQRLSDVPESRVIPDDHPLYVYYRWYWKSGDGWNGLNTALREGLRSTGRDDLWTFHDPAVRVASVYGSGGGVDVLSQWTYSYPDPLRIGLATDELLAMAAGAERPQQVMKMTQVIWYRSQTAPQPKTPDQPLGWQADWERQQPDAPFITIAPMHLREAFWTKMARPIRGIMYHGWQSLVPTDSPSGYRFTHPETQHELSRLVRDVVRPLGPTLLQVPDAPSDVAFLESFASEMFAKRGTYGWGGGWAGDCYHVLLYAGLQPRVVFDETVTQGGLDGARLLVMPDCDVLTASVVQRIEAFQAAGGLVVGDERTCPAVQPDIRIPVYQRSGRAEEDKRQLQARAETLRGELDSRYQRGVDSSNPDVVPYRRRWGQADYVFAVNDRREYGQYVGHHGIVMENGLPSESRLTVRRPGGVVYDLLRHCPVAAEVDQGTLRFPVRLGPCEGGVFLLTEQAIESLEIAAPQEISRGQQATLRVRVLDASARPIAAVVPVQLTITDPEGREAEFSGYYGAAGGELEVAIEIAPNDRFGVWTVRTAELASGRTAAAYFRVPGPDPWPPAPPATSPKIADPVQPRG